MKMVHWSKKEAILHITQMIGPFDTMLNMPPPGGIPPIGAPAPPDDVLTQLLNKAKEENK